MLLREFKKGAKNIFGKLNKIIDEIFGFGEEVGDHALTRAEKRWKEKQKAQKERIERKNQKYSPDNIIGNGIYNCNLPQKQKRI